MSIRIPIYAWLRSGWARIAAAAFGFVVFLLQGGGAVLRPTDTSWITPGSDWGYHWVGWLFFRHAPWQLPVGAIPSLLYPVGTTVGYMDGIPWLAVLCKLLSPLVPASTQYIGPWLALCFTLQGWFGARLVGALTTSQVAAALGGGLFVVAPVLLGRIVHEALCAQFLLLAALTLVVRRETRAPRWTAVGLPAFTIGIHPYLAVMVLGICIAAILRYYYDGLLRFGGVVLRILVSLLLVSWIVALLGYFAHGLRDSRGTGFGFYSTDLFSLINPAGYSRILPSLPTRPGQEEGFGFLGTGVLALGVSALVVEVLAMSRRARPLRWGRVIPLVVVAASFFLFALGSRITALGREFLDASFLYPSIFAETFRSSGRFVWVMDYTLLTGALGIWFARRPALAPSVVLGCLALQVAEPRGVFFTERFGAARPVPHFSAEWDLARGELRHMALYPPRCGDASATCCEGFTPPPRPDDMYLAALAARLGLTYNGFGAARVARREHGAYCAALQAAVAEGRLDPQTLYVVSEDHESTFLNANPTAPCGRLDAELVCVAPRAKGRLRDRLAHRLEEESDANPELRTETPGPPPSPM